MESEEESDYRRRDKFRSERQTCHQPGRPHYQPEPEWRRAGPPGPPGPPSYKRPRHDFMERKPAQRSVETPVSEGYQPAKMTFKAFLSTQSDDITDEEAAFKYSEYKLEFRRQQLNEFFSCHKEAEWFRRKYHPEESSKRAEELLDRVKKRLEIFVELDREGRLDVSLQTDNEHALLRLLNTVVIKLEGGGEQHLKILDMDSAALAATEEENDQEAVKELHLTSSVFLPLLSPQVTHSELEEVCRKFPGYLRLSLSQPDQTKKWSRRAWVTFERKAKIKELCLRLNHVRLRGKELNPVVNKDLSKRIRSVPSLYSDQSIARNDLKIASKIITNLDNKNSLWINANNPVLSNVHDYLIDEVAAEEEELLRRPVDTAEAGDDPDSKRELEINKEILQVLDKLILYLRIVHSTDFYSSAQYPLEDEMPNRLGLLHVRERPEEEEMLSRAEVSRLSVSRDNKLTALSQATTALKGEEALKLGLKTESDEVEKFVSSNCQEISKDKWLCPLSGKKFKAPDFIRKHILNKFPEQVEKVKQETEFYNNYIRDPARPELPESPNKPVVQTQPKPPARPARNTEDFNDNEDTGEAQAGVNRFTTGRKRTIHERLGRTIRATHTVTDPRKIVDYSDVDIGGYAD